MSSDWFALLDRRPCPFIDPRHGVQCMIHERVYTISLDKASLIRLTSSLFWRAHVSMGARQRVRSAMAATRLHGGGCYMNPCPHIDVHS
jgi:hypothetical protein